MIDWLLRGGRADPQVEVAGRILPVVLRRTAQAKRMTMRLAPDGSEVRITLPTWGRTAEALDFAQRRAGWLAGQLAAVPERTVLGHGSALAYLGEARTVHHDPAAPRRVRVSEQHFHVGGPAESLAPRLTRWLQGEAKRLLAEDLAHYCAVAGQPVPRLMLSSARRRWGSCAHDGTIRINWRLIMAPPEVLDYVAAHEVAHLAQMNHSPAFWAEVARLFPGHLEARRWLKTHGATLHGYRFA